MLVAAFAVIPVVLDELVEIEVVVFETVVVNVVSVAFIGDAIVVVVGPLRAVSVVSAGVFVVN